MPRKDPVAAKQYWDEYRKTDRCKERQARWREKHRAWRNAPENKDVHYGDNIRRLYGIGIEQYREMFANQGGKCAICGKHQDSLTKRLGVDHDHKTGLVRGLLCLHCNHAIGKFADDPEVLQKAIDYLRRQPGGSKEEKQCVV